MWFCGGGGWCAEGGCCSRIRTEGGCNEGRGLRIGGGCGDRFVNDHPVCILMPGRP